MATGLHCLLDPTYLALSMKKIQVLFVCTGNICRSPTAEGVFVALVNKEQVAQRFVIESAGTHAYHLGEAPDLRTQKAAEERGISLAQMRARKVSLADFAAFDYLLAMDKDNYDTLMNAAPDQHQAKIKLFLDFATQSDAQEVPDPYYGGEYGFERVLDMVEDGALGFLDFLRQTGELS